MKLTYGHKNWKRGWSGLVAFWTDNWTSQTVKKWFSVTVWKVDKMVHLQQGQSTIIRQTLVDCSGLNTHIYEDKRVYNIRKDFQVTLPPL